MVIGGWGWPVAGAVREGMVSEKRDGRVACVVDVNNAKRCSAVRG